MRPGLESGQNAWVTFEKYGWVTFWRAPKVELLLSNPNVVWSGAIAGFVAGIAHAALGIHGPAEGSIEAPLTTLAELQEKGLIRHIGLSNVTPAQIAEAQRIAPIVCVQNQYNLAQRADDALITDLARDGIPYVPFFPLGGFTPLQSAKLSDAAMRLDATPMQVALAWLLQRSPNILVIPGTSSIDHLHENLGAATLQLPLEVIAELDSIGANPPILDKRSLSATGSASAGGRLRWMPRVL